LEDIGNIRFIDKTQHRADLRIDKVDMVWSTLSMVLFNHRDQNTGLPMILADPSGQLYQG